jgi:hypothetical protein
MRPWTLGAVAVAVVSVGIAYGSGAFRDGSQSHVSPPPRPGAAEKAAIRQAVLTVAAQLGEPSPTDGVLVPTTTKSAELVDTDTDQADLPVYFVLVHGRFTDDSTSTTGTMLALTVDPATIKVLNAGFVGSTPNLQAIGIPEPLPLPADS